MFPAAVFNVANTVISANSIQFSWSAGSSLTKSYLIYGQRASSSRDLPVGNWTLLQNSTRTSCTVGSLASGAFYTFSVHSITDTGEDSNQAAYSFQTTSTSSGASVPEGGAFQCEGWGRWAGAMRAGRGQGGV